MGYAHRIVLQFETAWWMKKNKPAPRFVHGRDEPFPVWWTATPPELPYLTGWAGGPRAVKLSGKSQEELVAFALDSAASVFDVKRRRLEGLLRAAYSHDWTSDPYSRGAYSYGRIGAGSARERLRRPVSNTLFLAGEALADEGHNATVPGALRTGLSTAAELLEQTAPSS
jgi:monoamine oxidase